MYVMKEHDFMWRARSEGLVIQRFENEVLVYDLENNRAHCLNTASAVIWKGCDGSRSVAGLREFFENETGSRVKDDFILLGCTQLQEKGLLTTEESRKLGISRRTLIRNAALTASAALPVVMSIIAPKAVAAASALPPGSPCQSGPQCASGQCVGVGNGVKICR